MYVWVIKLVVGFVVIGVVVGVVDVGVVVGVGVVVVVVLRIFVLMICFLGFEFLRVLRLMFLLVVM